MQKKIDKTLKDNKKYIKYLKRKYILFVYKNYI